MERKNKIKFLVGLISAIVIVIAILNQLGIVSEIQDAKKVQQMKKSNGVWDSETIGDFNVYMEIFDAQARNNLADNIGYLSKKKIGDNDDENINYEKIATMNNYTYKDVLMGMTGENVSKNNDDKQVFFMFVPDDCEYITVAGKKIKVQHGSINTVKNVKVKINLCLFAAKMDYDRKGKIKLYTKKGKIFQYRENGEGKWL
ncbi:unknown [Clostridium sp. CAG:122]|uniref:hypothetical protein n=1 Tax=Butyribacter sp. TaxID=2822465 RepID=UPI000337345D|nr:unknown [Clostridium sp. CAG:122]